VHLFNDFHRGDLDLKRLNFALVTLIPKVGETQFFFVKITYLYKIYNYVVDNLLI